tara:strand:+ start:146 stop:472 length:327 start_codon:yes stop_codon:yes gene_type:complete
VFTALALVGVVISGQLLALAIPLFGVVGITAKQGTQVNTKSGRYRKYRSVFGVRTGAWQEIDESEVLLLLPMNTQGPISVATPDNSLILSKNDGFFISQALTTGISKT